MLLKHGLRGGNKIGKIVREIVNFECDFLVGS